jgi:urease accessory protein
MQDRMATLTITSTIIRTTAMSTATITAPITAITGLAITPRGIGTVAETIAPAALVRLQNLMSPAFPVGSFSYSHGLESAVEAGRIGNAESLREWLAALVAFGSGWNDAVLLAEAWRSARSDGDVIGLAELGAALAGSLERHTETMLQGAAFIAAAKSGWPGPALDDLPDPCPYPIAGGAVAAAYGLPLDAALAAFLQAFAANLAQTAIRLGVVGQNGAVAVIAGLEPTIVETAARAAMSDLDDLGSATVLSDIMAMRHETKYSRLFRS